MTAPAPNQIGINSTLVRSNIQNILDTFKTNLANPEYVKFANKAVYDNNNPNTNGTLIYIIGDQGQLNNAEIAAFEADWVSAGWTSAVCVNKLQKPTDSKGYSSWTFTLTYIP